jgi:hypothetical protein
MRIIMLNLWLWCRRLACTCGCLLLTIDILHTPRQQLTKPLAVPLAGINVKGHLNIRTLNDIHLFPPVLAKNTKDSLLLVLTAVLYNEHIFYYLTILAVEPLLWQNLNNCTI